MIFPRILIATLVTLRLSSMARGDPPVAYRFYPIRTTETQYDVFVDDINDRGMIVGGGRFPGYETNTGLLWINGTAISVADMCSNDKLVMEGSIDGISEFGHMIGGGGAGLDACCVALCFEGQSFAFPVIEGCEDYDNGRISPSGEFGLSQCDADTLYPVIHFLADQSTIIIGLFPDLDPRDAANAEPFAVNDDGLVVGTVFDLSNGGKGRAFIWQDGILTEIFDEFGGDALVAHDVNNEGHIVGFAGDEFNNDVAYIIRDGVMESLGYGEADAVNDRDVAVGNINTVDGVHAAVFDNGVIVDLDGFLPPLWGSSYANEINNYGWIIGDSSTGIDLDVGWLLVPNYDKGDYDGDEDVDLHDFGHFQECFAAEPYQGPEGGLHVGCSVFDFDDDVDLDLTDYAAFQSAFTGPITSGW